MVLRKLFPGIRTVGVDPGATDEGTSTGVGDNGTGTSQNGIPDDIDLGAPAETGFVVVDDTQPEAVFIDPEPTEEIIVENEDTANRVIVVIKMVPQEDGTSNLVVVLTKKIIGPIKVITFGVGGVDNTQVFQKGTILGMRPQEITISTGFNNTILNPFSFGDRLTVVSYGPGGLRPVLEVGQDFEGSKQPFFVWNLRNASQRSN